ncbi:methyltransferase [Actinomadura sp. J1-007]|nr:methyltransferase [Actinomadura sp. J1-007]MWK40599.1 methyltransferase [Actinomadura sp. J1-007]
MSGTCLYEAWGGLEFSVRTGSPAFENVHGQGLWEYLDAQPEDAAHFARTMGSSSGYYLSDILEVHDFSAARLLVDLGAGDGELVAQVLVRNPRLRAIAVDLPAMAVHTRRTLESRGVSDRCEVRAESFFDAVPPGADLYVLKAVLHNWDDEQAAAILRNCRAASAPDGRLLVIERVAEDTGGTLRSVVNDLAMLVLLGGRERTLREYDSLLGRAGYARTSHGTGAHGITVIEAAPVP